jgi:hypothetical protein
LHAHQPGEQYLKQVATANINNNAGTDMMIAAAAENRKGCTQRQFD